MLLFLRRQTEAVGQREHHITTHVVRPRFVATIGVDVLLPLRNLSQQVVALDLSHPAPLLPRLRQRGIPVEAVVVHICLRITTARVHLQVSIDGEVPRQLVVGIEAVVEVIGIDG